jgi:hypothetical protein
VAKVTKRATPRTSPDPARLRRAVTWARLPGHGHTIAEACARFAISPAVYRRAAREFGEAAKLSTPDEVVLAALHPGGPTKLDAIVYYFAWIDHRTITPAAVIVILERLIGQARVRRTGADFELAVDWP